MLVLYHMKTCSVCQEAEDHHCRGLGFMLLSSSLNVNEVTPVLQVEGAKSEFHHQVFLYLSERCLEGQFLVVWSNLKHRRVVTHPHSM
jgi:hypothetical protein